MKRINMAKYGFMRAAELDFTDDGSRFSCYYFKVGSESHVSKCTYNGEVFLSAHVNGNLTYEVYSNLPHYQAANWKYNGVNIEELTDQDLQDFFNACVAYENEYRTAEANTKYPTFKEIEARCAVVQAKCQREYDEAAKLISEAALNGTLLKISKYDIGYVLEYLKNLKNAVNNWEPKIRAAHLLGKAESLKLMEPDYYELKNESFYVKTIKEYLEKAN